MSDALPAVVAALYAEHRRATQGTQYKSYRPAASQAKFFARTASVIAKHHADPAGYIQAQFLFWPIEGGFPWPSQLATPAALQRWSRYREQCELDPLKLYLAQVCVVRGYLQTYPGCTVLSILVDPAVPLHAFFRVLLARDGAKGFLPDAQREILNSSTLRRFLERSNVNVRDVFGI